MCSSEFLHRRLSFLAYSHSIEDLTEGQPEDFHVEPEGLMVHIPHIQSKLVVPTDGIATIHLRPSGYAGAKIMATDLLGGIERQIIHEKRPGADEAHLPLQHIDQLR